MSALMSEVPVYLQGLEGSEVLPQALAIAYECDAELKVFASLAKQTSESMWRIGVFANRMKEVLPHGNYEAWEREIAEKLRKSASSIRDYRQVAEKFPTFQKIADYMPITSAVKLSAGSVSDEAREEAIALAEAGVVVDGAIARQLKSSGTVDLESGDRVFCNGNKSVSGEFLRMEGDRALIKLDDGAVEKFSAHAVALAPSESDLEISAPPIKNKRIKNDYYPTPDGIVQHLLARVPISGKVLEPCAGHGAIAAHFNKCITNEPFPVDGFECNFNMDATDPLFWEALDLDGGFDWAVTNPPYGLSTPIVAASLTHAKKGVAMLLRINWLEPCSDRAVLLQEHTSEMSDIIWFNPRPQFRRDVTSTDNVTVAWVVWRKGWKKGCTNHFVNDWKQ